MESEKKLSHQLIDEIRNKEDEMARNNYNCPRVQSILINYEIFDELAREKDIWYQWLMFTESGIQFCGIPITETDDIEKWELRG